ncbi:hypothetical protein MCUN1_001002 [Malassezia cuniculi]|uniref:YTH domain-containing protein n=1 Tax=Malassezia cuniculi TaxID=948313 RepID=A0AAF0ETN0_9BASI|nr:hypothetical protein MCUN1_001002 [Malassezia cuniculi]
MYYINPHQSPVPFAPPDSSGQFNTRSEEAESGGEHVPVSAYPIPVYQPTQFYYSGAPILGAYTHPNMYFMPMRSPSGPSFTTPPGDTGHLDATQQPSPPSSSALGYSDGYSHDTSGYPSAGHSALPTNYAYPYPMAYPYYGYPSPSVFPPMMGHPFSVMPGYRAPDRPTRGRRQSHGRRRAPKISRSPPKKTDDPKQISNPSSPSSQTDELHAPSAFTMETAQEETPQPAPAPAPASPPAPQFALSNYESQRQGVRSNYVMWCGNVAQDATLDELWAFFISIPKDDTLFKSDEAEEDGTPAVSRTVPTEESPSGIAENHAGILSIFIISRSSCAFVNYATEAALERACAYFHGKQLRAKPTSPKLVCRPRKQEDAEYAGVAAQRGKGVHVAWFKQQKELAQQQRLEQMFSKATLAPESESSRLGDDNSFEDWKTTSSSSGDSRSFASTNSSLLRQPEFRVRFFILKSRTREALDAALKTSTWATQSHNEGVLNQAFRNSQTVYLLFSENLSGQLYGCATMASEIGGPTSPRATQTDVDELCDQIVTEPSSIICTSDDVQNALQSPNIHAATDAPDDSASQRQRLSFSYTSPSIAADNHAHEQLATSAMIHNLRLDLHANDEKESAHDAQSSAGAESTQAPAASEPVFGRPFSIRWVITQPLPFSKIQHLRNPWRDNRLVKVSRDGTELEPHVGDELLKVWESHLAEQQVEDKK